MTATLDKEKGNVGGAQAVLDRPEVENKRVKSPAKERKGTGSEAWVWEVRSICDDGSNTREFIARCLVQIVGVSELKAYQTMMQAHGWY